MIKAAILDLDGTVYEGSRLIEGADAAMKFLYDYAQYKTGERAKLAKAEETEKGIISALEKL